MTISPITENRYSSSVNKTRLEQFRFLRNLSRIATRTAVVLPTKTDMERLTDNICVVEDMTTICCYCKQKVELPYTWIFNLATRQLLMIVDPETGKEFHGWASIVPGQERLNMKHPHANGRNICTGNGSTAFKGKYAARDALMTGLNPGSPFFNIKAWLASVGHVCAAVRFCPTHGYNCSWIDEYLSDELYRAAGWNCSLRYIYQGTMPCTCEGEAIVNNLDKPHSHIICGSKQHAYSWKTYGVVDLTDISDFIINKDINPFSLFIHQLYYYIRPTTKYSSIEEIKTSMTEMRITYV